MTPLRGGDDLLCWLQLKKANEHQKQNYRQQHKLMKT